MNVRVSWQQWHKSDPIPSRQFVCGYCGKEVGAHMGYRHNVNHDLKIALCPSCGLPTLLYQDEQSPGPILGRTISGLPDDIGEVYRELRDTAKSGSFTATALLGRKLIMHIAVEAGAEEGKSFKQYVTYLAQQHYVPPKSDKLLEYMRELGNEKNHEIKLGNSLETQRILKFVESLLYFVYELESEFDDGHTDTTADAEN